MQRFKGNLQTASRANLYSSLLSQLRSTEMEKHELKLIILQTPAEPVLLPRVPSSQLLYLYLFNDGDPPSKYGLALSCRN